MKIKNLYLYWFIHITQAILLIAGSAWCGHYLAINFAPGHEPALTIGAAAISLIAIFMLESVKKNHPNEKIFGIKVSALNANDPRHNNKTESEIIDDWIKK